MLPPFTEEGLLPPGDYPLTFEQLRKSHQRKHFEDIGLTPEQVNRALEPAYSFHEQLKEEVEWYERIKRRDFGTIDTLTALGPLLVALRIANGITQKELANRLNVDESQVSRDERNEYHGISLERAQRIINALGEKLIIRVDDKTDNKELAIA
ncbi:MAG TPA: helix-turn-helix transcriptional regulator [Candidatus Obscuribacterales bacterium]